jgi:hypothetical protein
VPGAGDRGERSWGVLKRLLASRAAQVQRPRRALCSAPPAARLHAQPSAIQAPTPSP